MSKWIADGSIDCKEVQGTRQESYNSTTGTPVFRARLEVPNGNFKGTLAKLLGEPEAWPHSTNFLNVRCISAERVIDNGQYSTDGDGKVVNHINPNLVDLTYTPRTGSYVALDIGVGADVYVDTILEPRNESRPLNPEHFIWGETQDVVPTDTTRVLLANQAPMKYEPGDILTHTVEGWPFDTTNLEDYPGTCNDADFYSSVLNRTFKKGTLLLDNIQITKAYSFISYRSPAASPPTPPQYDYSGLAAQTLKFIYNYKSIGWDKYYRYDANTTNFPPGYYYIRYAHAPYGKYLQHPLRDHSDWLW